MKPPAEFVNELRLVNELRQEQREELRALMKTSNEEVKRRAHAVRLSARGYRSDRIADISEGGWETRKRPLKKGHKVWKRLRRSTRGKRDEADFQAAKVELAGLRAQAAAGEIDFYYYDVDILGRMIKSHWLPLKAYGSFKDLRRSRIEL